MLRRRQRDRVGVAWGQRMTTVETLTFLAILLSPVIAVLVSMRVQDHKDKAQRRFWVFATLVQNRHQKITSEVVQAMNLIDISFYKDDAVRLKWKEYREIAEQDLSKPITQNRMDEIYVEMLHEMAKALGLGKRISQINLKQMYCPSGLGYQFDQTWALLHAALQVLNGERPLLVAAAPSAPTTTESHVNPDLGMASPGEVTTSELHADRVEEQR